MSISAHIAKKAARISQYLNPNSRRAIHHSFIDSNFSYCPLVWHFSGETNNAHDDVIKWKHFPRYWPFVATKTSDAELWCFSLICVWMNGCVNNREAGDLRRYRVRYDVGIMKIRKVPRTILCNDYSSSYEDLPRNTGLSTLLLSRLRCMLLKTFKYTQPINVESLHCMYIQNTFGLTWSQDHKLGST